MFRQPIKLYNIYSLFWRRVADVGTRQTLFPFGRCFVRASHLGVGHNRMYTSRASMINDSIIEALKKRPKMTARVAQKNTPTINKQPPEN